MTVSTRQTPIWLWIVQGALMLLFLQTGGRRLMMPHEQMIGSLALAPWFMRGIGLAEVLGALGLVLPAATGIKPGLTRVAALALLPIMVGATLSQALGKSLVQAASPFVVLCLLACVAYVRGRLRSRS